MPKRQRVPCRIVRIVTPKGAAAIVGLFLSGVTPRAIGAGYGLSVSGVEELIRQAMKGPLCRRG